MNELKTYEEVSIMHLSMLSSRDGGGGGWWAWRGDFDIFLLKTWDKKLVEISHLGSLKFGRIWSFALIVTMHIALTFRFSHCSNMNMGSSSKCLLRIFQDGGSSCDHVVGITYNQIPNLGDMTFNQNPCPGDRPHDQIPVVSPTPPPHPPAQA